MPSAVVLPNVPTDTHSTHHATEEAADRPDFVALLRVVKQGLLAKVQSAVAASPMLLNCRGMWDSTPLLVACQYAHSDVALHLLSVGADATLVNEKHVSAVLLASLEGLTEVLTCLLTTIPRDHLAPLLVLRGTVYNSFTDNNSSFTPLLAACTNGHAECVGLLLDATTQDQLNVPADDSRSPLLAAAGHGHTAVLHLLLQHGADPSVCDAGGNNALLTALAGGFDATAVAIVRAAPGTAAVVNAEGLTSLHVAARSGCVETVTLLLATSSSLVPATTAKGETALLLAARKKNVRIVEALVRAGANVDACDATGQSARQVLVNTKQVYLVAVVESMANGATTPSPPEVSSRPLATTPEKVPSSAKLGCRRRSSRRNQPTAEPDIVSPSDKPAAIRHKGSHRAGVSTIPDSGESSPLQVGRRRKPSSRRRRSCGNMESDLDKLDGLVKTLPSSPSASSGPPPGTPTDDGPTPLARGGPTRHATRLSKSVQSLHTTAPPSLTSRSASMRLMFPNKRSQVRPLDTNEKPTAATHPSAVHPLTSPLPTTLTDHPPLTRDDAVLSINPTTTTHPLSLTATPPQVGCLQGIPPPEKAALILSNMSTSAELATQPISQTAPDPVCDSPIDKSTCAASVPSHTPDKPTSCLTAKDSAILGAELVSPSTDRPIRQKPSHGGLTTRSSLNAPVRIGKRDLPRQHRSVSVLVSPSTLDALDRIGALGVLPPKSAPTSPTAANATHVPSSPKIRSQSSNSVDNLQRVSQVASSTPTRHSYE
ncbi:hypothetical protein, variant [Aphanomyces astaci]|nr:hypothetical protein, variant [Aphanomyces astaci]ETV83867.1 hypothetical protein, variant [Aphanomyces astaci]|eukprot:XP_009827297.1 hypothetical protein, variant [Aphanomyces astaci]